jgi:outer membrane protein assembly factor BamB
VINGNTVCDTAWSTTLDSAPRFPVLSSDESTVYVTTANGTLYAIDATNGNILWRAAVSASSAPALSGGTVFVGTSAGALVALAAAGCGNQTCTPLWSGTTGATTSVQAAVAGGVVYAGSDDGSLHAFAAAGCGHATCTALWTYQTGSKVTGAPALGGNHLVVGTADGNVRAFAVPSRS